MVRALVQRAFDASKMYFEFVGLSTDDKPKARGVTGSQFIEVDTGDLYRFDESGSGTWHKNPPDPAEG